MTERIKIKSSCQAGALLQALLSLQNLHVRKNGGEFSVDGCLDVESVLTFLVKYRQS